MEDRRSRSTPGDGADLADQPRQPVPGLAVAVAAQVDSREDDLAVTLRDAALDLGEHGGRRAAPRRAPNLGDHAEAAREAAPVLDLHEGAHPAEADVRLDAPERPDGACDEAGRSFARKPDDFDVLGKPVEAPFEVRRAAGHVDAPRATGRPARFLAGLSDGLVRDAARVDDRDVDRPFALDMAVGDQALAQLLGVRVRDLATEERAREGRHDRPMLADSAGRPGEIRRARSGRRPSPGAPSAPRASSLRARAPR